MSYFFRTVLLNNQHVSGSDSKPKPLVQTVLSTLPSRTACLFIATVIFMVTWNLALSNSLTTLVSTAFVAIAVLTLTLTLVVSVGVCGVWVVRMVARGEEATREDLVKAGQERIFGLGGRS